MKTEQHKFTVLIYLSRRNSKTSLDILDKISQRLELENININYNYDCIYSTSGPKIIIFEIEGTRKDVLFIASFFINDRRISKIILEKETKTEEILYENS